MCGIVGANNKNWDFESAVQTLRHRGPDSQKIVHLENISLGFARLAIIDLSHEADQPMSNLEKTVWIVFNGEIYGFNELRKELLSLGKIFRTHSDTEVLLNAYLQWGDQFVDHIDGMFALAIYDSRIHQLKLLRDRCGIKPLFYFLQGKQIAFASELKGITTLCKDIVFEYDYTAIFDYLTFTYIPTPKTLYKNVFKLPPAHQLTYDLKSQEVISLKPYWTLNVFTSPQNITLPTACDQLKNLIHESVRDQLIADVPVGVFLSGGMDSSTVVAEAATITKDVKTFSIGFNVPELDESHYATIVAKHFNTQHYRKTLTQTDTDSLIERLKKWYDEPFADTSALPSYLVAALAKENVTVALSGDGGDEVFGGYVRYDFFRRSYQLSPIENHALYHFLKKLRKNLFSLPLLAKAVSCLEILSGDWIQRYAFLMEALSTEDKSHYANLWGIHKDYDSYWYFRKYYRKDLPLLTRLQYLDFHTYLPDDILTKVDRISMAVSLEVRVPLLSKKIIEFLFSLPEKIRYPNGQLKGLMKETYKNILPLEILNRAKKGFGIPMDYLNLKNISRQEKILKEIFKIP